MAGYDPNSVQGIMAYWNDRGGAGTPGARGAAPRPHHAAPKQNSVEALRDRVNAQRQAMMSSIQSKIVRSNVLGVPDKSLIPMSDLNRAGISADRTPDGLPYGIDPSSLTADEREFLGIQSAPLAGLYGGG